MMNDKDESALCRRLGVTRRALHILGLAVAMGAKARFVRPSLRRDGLTDGEGVLTDKARTIVERARAAGW